MTKRPDSPSLKFRNKKISPDWGKSHQDGDHSPDHIAGASVIVLHPHLITRSARAAGTSFSRTPAARLDEAVSLCDALGLNVIEALCLAMSKLVPATYIGRGKLLDLADMISRHDIELVIIDCDLTPGQQRNIERLLKVKVIDRTGLILEIFGERAQTKEGVLQVELAHLSYQKSRLVRSWTHLERQRGGFGFLGGPGESQIESDRRLIGARITRIKKQLDDVSRTRALHRSGRKKNHYPVVAMVGYTNAGKSTLFNYLTKADVVVADMLFATLDPTMREFELAKGKKVILSDTVGFISALPTGLVAAFRATLEDVVAADLILHVRDISHPDTEAQKADVMAVLKSLGLEKGPDCLIHEVWNKSDLLSSDQRQTVDNQLALREDVSLLSAFSGDGCDHFRLRLAEILAQDTRILKIAYGHDQGAAIAWLYKHGNVVDRQDMAEETILTVRIGSGLLGRIKKDPALAGRLVQ